MAISIQSSKVTLSTFLKITYFLTININKIPKMKTKQSLKTLVKNNPSIKKIDIEDTKLTKEDLKIFKSISKKCGLKYALIHNPIDDKITFFFNSAKAEVYEQVYNELRKKLDDKNKPTLKENLKQNTIEVKIDKKEVEKTISKVSLVK